MSDYYNIIDTAVEAAEKRGREEGMEKGRAEGLEEGIEKQKREIAYRLISMGMSDDDIIIATGLSTDELAELKTE